MSFILTSEMDTKELVEVIKNYNEMKAREKSDLSNGKRLLLNHGTTSSALKEILKNGLVGRKESGRSNFEHAESSESLVYLTNKWGTLYSFIAARVSFENYLNSKGIEIPDNLTDYEDLLCSYWETNCDVPVVLTVEVNENDLLIDEDIIYNKVFRRELNERGSWLMEDIDYTKSLNQYTVACKSPISVENIKKVEVIAYSDLLTTLLHSEYGTKYGLWCIGFTPVVDEEMAKEEMMDWNLGAFDELNLNMALNSDYNIRYSKNDCCVFIDYK